MSTKVEAKKTVLLYDYRKKVRENEAKKGENIPGGSRILKNVEERKEDDKRLLNLQLNEFEEKVIKVKRVSKTTRGGRQSRVWVLVAAGNKKGKLGFAIGKSREYSLAFRKAARKAVKNAIKVPMNSRGTIYHEFLGKHNASKVLLKPAKSGTGIIAGGPVKKLLLLAGYKDLYSKNLGANNPVNMVRATFNALLSQQSPKQIARLRDKTFEELFHLPPRASTLVEEATELSQ
ncbi:30S ribosomal protein S5 [Candidatus Mycoplasma haematominutum]|uniref:Small ribosomal subunit protein uS5 n=1 Tax=Candidatus Mycoplasma haematominutum 'Birmingham 1' TaxID=1116213 RepID=G8C332_9MOLU|nr:30S ribosomal protein S5 [Candidatus Mycoplasma haematominutum]CCE66730.1 ribosomal protein S5 [Candidatus Mycoplasma haematominutum 'Birmingham 1']